MNRIKHLSALGLILALCATSARAFDSYGGLRTLIVDAPRQIVGLSNNNVTNTAPVDIHMFDGIVKIDFWGFTNGPGTLTVNVQTSPDKATWTALQNYSISSQSTVIYTNGYYGTNLTATNVYNLPGTIVTPTASTAGFATPYFDASSAPFTNSGAITLPGDRFVTVGFKADDAGRFLRVYYTTGGTITNLSCGAILTGKLVGGPGAP